MALSEQALSELRALVGAPNVLTSREDLIPYSFDGTAALQRMPGCVLFVSSTAQISQLLQWANRTRTAIFTLVSGPGLGAGSLLSPDCL